MASGMFDFNNSANAIMQNQQMLNTYFANMQNMFTPGYKAESIQFNDIMNNAMGGGAKEKEGGIIFTQGQIFNTPDKPTNLAIDGAGFFVVSDGVNRHYTRDGRFSFVNGVLANPQGMKVLGFQLDAQGNLASSDPQPIELSFDPNTKLYGGKYTGFRFDETGKLYGETTITDPVTGQTTQQSVPLYQVAVGSFANPSALKKTGTTTFGESANSGQAVIGVAGQGALGRVAPGSLELANVDFAQQAAAIGMAKQMYEANFAAFRAMDKLTQSAI
ncbi:MAG TPA: flagellar hook-basal body complex protein, partial [Candidatus Nitrosotenuis sp.]|nr:flagellar hook-basal body complex protein [Candidatus Nitrosotenuis sp.]